MKKNLRIFFATLAMTACGMANAQQLPNGNFEDEWVTCYPWESGNYTTSGRGTQPKSWCVSNISNTLAGTVASKVDGYSGKAVELKNTDALGNPIPAYMTLGTTWATAEAKLTGATRNEDGGVFGGISFTYRPDALRFKYKSVSDQKNAATVVVYSWKGTWTQADVPSNTAVGIVGYGTATKKPMTDRDVNILGKPHNTGGTVTHTSDAKLIASMSQTINELPSEWATFQKDLVYESTTDKPEKINVVIAAAGYQSTASITSGASITIDDVELVYYHSLTSLSYDGKAVAGFNENTLNYDLSDKKYEASKVSYTVKGVAATVAESYNEMTDVLTINVTGDDGAVTTYNVQFMKKTSANFAVTDAKYGTFAAPFEVTIPADAQAYVCDGTTASGNALVLTEITGSIPANTPVVVYSENPLSNSVAGYNENNATEARSGLLVGVYADTTVPEGAYVLQKQGDKAVGFYKVSTANTINIKANHAYLSSSLSKAPAIFFTEDEEATAVTSLNALMSGEVESVNNASGVRQSGIQKGLNIVKTTDGSVHKILVK